MNTRPTGDPQRTFQLRPRSTNSRNLIMKRQGQTFTLLTHNGVRRRLNSTLRTQPHLRLFSLHSRHLRVRVNHNRRNSNRFKILTRLTTRPTNISTRRHHIYHNLNQSKVKRITRNRHLTRNSTTNSSRRRHLNPTKHSTMGLSPTIRSSVRHLHHLSLRRRNTPNKGVLRIERFRRLITREFQGTNRSQNLGNSPRRINFRISSYHNFK